MSKRKRKQTNKEWVIIILYIRCISSALMKQKEEKRKEEKEERDRDRETERNE